MQLLRNFQEATIPHCFWGSKSGRRIWMQRAGPRPCTYLLAFLLTPEHLLGPPQGWAGLSHSDRCFSPPSAPPPSVGATRFRVTWAPMGQWPCAHSPLQLGQGLSVAPAKAQRAPRGPRPQCLLREGSQELLQGPLLWVMFWLWGDFSNVPKRCGRRRRIF